MKSFDLWLFGILVIALLFALLTGGASREGLHFHLVLNAYCWIGIFLILAFSNATKVQSIPRTPLILLGVVIFWCILTMIPVPERLISDSQLKNTVINERRALDIKDTFMTLSYGPKETLRSLLAFGPPVFGFIAAFVLDKRLREWIVVVIILLGIMSLIIGFTQIFLGSNTDLYFWEITNRGFAVGVFANVNHQTSFAALLIPLVLFVVSKSRKHMDDRGIALRALLYGLLLFFIIGVVSGGSVAGYISAIFALIFSFFVLRNSEVKPLQSSRIERTAYSMGFGLVILMVFFSPWLSELGITSLNQNGELGRIGMLKKAIIVIKDTNYIGTGLGTLEDVYRVYENPDLVTSIFVNHLHNDYVEWVLELGLPGLFILSVFFVWLMKRCTIVFTSGFMKNDNLLPLCTLISVSVMALHSIVDYPLRTPVLAIITGVLLGVTAHISEPSVQE